MGGHARRWAGASLLVGAAWAAAPAAAPAAAKDILVGQIAPIGVASTPEARQLHEGTRACVADVNRRGGVRGRRLELVAIDDELRAPLLAQKFDELLARQPLALVNVMGSAVLAHLLDSRLLDRHELVVIGAIPGAEAFRQPGHPRLFHVRSGDRVQLERVLLHSRTLGIRRIHVLHQDAGIGRSGLAVLQAGAERLGGFTLGATMSTLADADIARAVRATAAAQPEAVVVIGFPHFMADALARLRRAGVHQAVFALGYLSPQLAWKAAGPNGARGLGLTQAIPNPNGRVMPLQREFQQAMRQFDPALDEYTSFHLEGCVGVRVLVEGLRRIDGPPTPAALAQALRAMGEVDLGGFRVHFGAGQVGSTWSDIGVVSASGRLLF